MKTHEQSWFFKELLSIEAAGHKRGPTKSPLFLGGNSENVTFSKKSENEKNSEFSYALVKQPLWRVPHFLGPPFYSQRGLKSGQDNDSRFLVSGAFRSGAFWRDFGGPLGRPWGCFGDPWASLGMLWRPMGLFGDDLGGLCRPFRLLESPLRPLGVPTWSLGTS